MKTVAFLALITAAATFAQMPVSRKSSKSDEEKIVSALPGSCTSGQIMSAHPDELEGFNREGSNGMS